MKKTVLPLIKTGYFTLGYACPSEELAMTFNF
jgi:hypothetical protein